MLQNYTTIGCDYKPEEVCSVQSYSYSAIIKWYPGYNMSQPDSLLPQGHLVRFQSNTLRGQADLVHELVHCNRKSVTASSSPRLTLNYGTFTELAAWGPRPGSHNSKKTINWQQPWMQSWYRVSQVVSLDFKYIFSERLKPFHITEPWTWRLR